MKTLSRLLMTNNQIIIMASVLSTVFLFAFITTIVILVKKRASLKANEAEVAEISNNIYKSLGKDNISSITLRNKRLALVINNIDLINKELLNQLKLGATLTSNVIKFSLNKNASAIYKQLKELLKG